MGSMKPGRRQPEIATPAPRASGLKPERLAKVSLHTSTAEAPSVRGEEVPAASEPSC